MAHKAPGKSRREGITIMGLAQIFPDETSVMYGFVEEQTVPGATVYTEGIISASYPYPRHTS